MAVKRFRDRRPRLLAPSRILRPTMRQTGGGRSREELVEEAREAIAKGSKSFAFASRLFDRSTRERAWMLYAWCRRCDDIADGQEFGGRLDDQADAENRVQAIRVLTRRALEGQPTADVAFDALGQVVFRLALTWIPADQPLFILVDDTLARKTGKGVSLATMHHDPLLERMATYVPHKPIFRMNADEL